MLEVERIDVGRFILGQKSTNEHSFFFIKFCACFGCIYLFFCKCSVISPTVTLCNRLALGSTASLFYHQFYLMILSSIVYLTIFFRIKSAIFRPVGPVIYYLYSFLFECISTNLEDFLVIELCCFLQCRELFSDIYGCYLQ